MSNKKPVTFHETRSASLVLLSLHWAPKYRASLGALEVLGPVRGPVKLDFVEIRPIRAFSFLPWGPPATAAGPWRWTHLAIPGHVLHAVAFSMISVLANSLNFQSRLIGFSACHVFLNMFVNKNYNKSGSQAFQHTDHHLGASMHFTNFVQVDVLPTLVLLLRLEKNSVVNDHSVVSDTVCNVYKL